MKTKVEKRANLNDYTPIPLIPENEKDYETMDKYFQWFAVVGKAVVKAGLLASCPFLCEACIKLSQ